MNGRRCLALSVLLAVTGLVEHAACAQAAARGTNAGPFKLSLADVNVCLETLNQAAKTMPDPARGALQAAAEILERARTTAGVPASTAPAPWAFANNLGAGPYLQNVTSSNVIVRWTAQQSDTTVRYGANGTLNLTATADRLPAPRRMHEARLTGLEAGARYAYSIRMGDRDVTGTFRAAPAGNEPFTFAVWGDSQMDNPDHSAQPALAAQMAGLPIDLALSVGDIVDLNVTDSDFYQEFFKPAADFLRNVPVFATLGNHEPLGDPDLARYRRWIRHPGSDKTYYAFTYANCRFIVLDSNDAGLVKGVQQEWLRQELSSDACKNARFRFLAVHHSPFCWDWIGGEQSVRQAVVPLAEENRVDAIFSGHYHCYNRGIRSFKDHKICYIVTGGGGGMFTEPPRFGPGHNEYDFMTRHEWKHHFVTVRVDAGELAFRAIDEKGEVFDEFSIGTVGAGAPSTPAARPPTPSEKTASAPRVWTLSPDETRVCNLSATDRSVALDAIKQCRRGLSAEASETSYRLELVAGVLEEARDNSREGSWSGPLLRTGHLIPLIKISESFHYRFKPSETADASVQAILDDKSAKGVYEVTGEDLLRSSAFGAGLSGGWRWVLVDSIVPK